MSQANNTLENQIDNANKDRIGIHTEELLNIITHDLQSPLSAIRCCTELLIEDPRLQDAPDLIKILATIRDSALSSFEIIENLLSFQKLKENTMQAHMGPCDVSAIIRELVQLLFPLSNKKQIKLNLHDKLEGCFIKADSIMIRQILSNLLSNAIKFSYNNTQINIFLNKAESNQALIQIEDQGPGIDPDDQDQLFNKFTQLKNKPTGGEQSSGLGLAIVKRFVDMNKGMIECKSTIGKGSTFSVQFALIQQDQ